MQVKSGAVGRRARGAAVAGLLALAGVVGGGCESCGERGPREREPLSMLPGDAWIVASADVSPVRSSPAYARVTKRRNLGAYYLGEQCSYDPIPTLDKLWVGAGDEFEKGRGVVIAEGTIDRDEVLDCLREHARGQGLKLEETEVEGFTVYSSGAGRLHVAWLDSETVAIGDQRTVEKVLALEKGKGTSARSNAKLLKLWERAARDRDVALAVVPTEAAVKWLAGFMPPAYSGLGTSREALLGLRFSKGLDLIVSVLLESTAEAEKLSKSLRRDLDTIKNNDFIAIAGLSSHLEAINVEQAGAEVTASAHYTERQLDSLVRFAVDSVDEIMNEGGDPEEAIRRRLKGGNKAAPDAAGPDAAAPADGGTKTPPPTPSPENQPPPAATTQPPPA